MIYNIRVRPMDNTWLISVCLWNNMQNIQTIDAEIVETQEELHKQYEKYFYKYIVK